MALNPLFDNIPDEALGDLLYQVLIVEGKDEVEIRHPTEGIQVVTKDNYKKLLASLARVKKMSPAQRIIENARIKTAQQNKHLAQMKEAEFFVVDMEDEENFGFDVNGAKIDMDKMTFVPVGQYLKGVKITENEVGVFICEDFLKPPIRIKQLNKNNDKTNNN